MNSSPEDVTDLADSLEREIEAQGEAAKRAIREYKKTIRRESGVGGARQLETRREVEQAVSQYIQLQRELDELRARKSTTQLIPRTR